MICQDDEILKSIFELMILVVNKYFFKRRFVGLTLWPFIVLKMKSLKDDQVLINHERIHLKQQLELLILPFYIWYAFEFFFKLLYYKNSNKAYINISFEREAYAMEGDLGYLKKRKPYSFFKFIK